jgi:hypothetical protein
MESVFHIFITGGQVAISEIQGNDAVSDGF